MNTNRFSTKKINRLFRSHFEKQVKSISVPPVPGITIEGENASGVSSHLTRNHLRVFPVQRSAGFIFSRVIAAVLLIVCGSFLFLYPLRRDPLALLISDIAEEEALEERITSGLQKAGEFIYENL